MRKFLAYSLVLLLLILGFLIGSNTYMDIPVEEMKAQYAPPPSQFVALQGMDVHYRDQGQGPVLLLIHGTGASLHTWEGWVRTLQDDFRIIRLDLPAFGLTGPHPNHAYDLDTYTSLINELLEVLSIDSCSIAGNSLGGSIAWAFALNYPEKVEKLVLIDAGGYRINSRSPSLVFKLAQTPLVNKIVRYVTPKSIMRKSLLEVYGNDTLVTDGLVELYHDMALREGNREAFVKKVIAPPVNKIWNISSIKVPSLIMWGAEDAWIPVSMVDSFLQDIPHAESIIYDGVGHVPMEEIPQISAYDAKNFLLGEDAPSAF